MTTRLNSLIAQKPRLISALFISTLALPVLAHVYNGHFTRLMADDYCFAAIVRARGLWGSAVYWYNNWTGTPSSTIGQSIVALLGYRAAALLPGFLLISWFFASIWAIYQTGLLFRVRYARFLAVLLGSLILYGVIQGIPNVYQAVYWTSGAVVYSAPIILLWLLLGIAAYTIRRLFSGWRLGTVLAICAGLTFIIGGFTQTIVAMQTTLLGIIMLGSWRYASGRTKQTALLVSSSSFTGSIAALLVTLLAPGNTIREAAHPVVRSITQISLLTVENTAAFFAMQLAFFSLIPILVCLILSTMAACRLQPLILTNRLSFKSALKWMSISTVIGALLIMAFLAPAAYGMGKMPASRAWIVPQTLLILIVICWGFVMGLSLRKPEADISLSWKAAAVALVLLIVGPIFAMIGVLSDTAELSTSAAEWDSRDQMIRTALASGSTEVTITPYTVDMATFAMLDITDDMASGDYLTCMQDYYGLNSVKVLESGEEHAQIERP